MNRDPKKPTSDDDLPDVELPPLAEDDEAGDLEEPLESLLEEQRDDGMSWLDDRVGIDDYDDETIAHEIGADDDGQEQSWIADSEADEELEGTEADLDDAEEYGWTEDNDTPSADEWEYDLDLGSEDGPSVLDDSGDEGLDEDLLDIDTSHWSELDEEEGEGVDDLGDDFELDTGMSFEEEIRMDGGLLPPPLDESQLKAAWLGPPGAPAVTVSFRSGRLYAAGLGLFVATSDKMVATGASSLLEDVQVTSIEIDPADPKVIFLGTTFGGLMVSCDGGDTVKAANGWVSAVRGCGTPAEPTVPVEISLGTSSGGSAEAGSATLWLLTGLGQLLRSTDAGDTWTTVLTEHRVLAVSSEHDGDAVAALVLEDDEPTLFWSGDGQEFERRELPLDSESLAESPSIAVRGEEVLLGAEDFTKGVLWSPSSDAEWTVLEDCPRATALSFAGALAGTFLAGLFFAGRDLGTMVRTSDSGGSWSRICDVTRLRDLFSVDQRGAEDVTSRIHKISVSSKTPRHVAIATGNGVFILEMKDL